MKRKLTTEEIKFIDTYLKNSGVLYADIRFEMADHVATALEEQEGDFYENFRQYMVENKAGLLASNRAFKKAASDRAWGIIKGNFLKLPFWTISLCLFAAAMLVKPYLNEAWLAETMRMALIVLFTPVALYFIYYRFFIRNANSVIDKLLTILYFGNILFRLDFLVDHNPVLLMLYFSLATALMMLLLQSLWQLNKKYKAIYHG